MKNKYLVFDMGGVLMKHDIPACIQRAREILGKNFSILGLGNDGEGIGLMEKFEKGFVGADEFVNTILEYSRTGTTSDEIIRTWNLMHAGIPEDRISTLRRLKGEGYGLSLLSNCNAIHWKDICDNYDIEGIFDEVFVSFREHCSKPDGKIYHIVEQRLGVSGSDIVFIDDLEANRETAQKRGWTTYGSLDELILNLK